MLLTFLVFFLLLSILVLVHELGHYTAAKKFGIKVEEFGFGLPPRIIGKRIGETIYSLNWLPIGGFVKLYGEDQDEHARTTETSKRAFFSRPAWQRAIVLTAGVSMNFLLAVVVLTYLFTQGVMVPTHRVHIDGVASGSPAANAGIMPKDIIATVNGEDITSSSQFQEITRKHLGEEMNVGILRGASLDHYRDVDISCKECKSLNIYLTPRTNPPKKVVMDDGWVAKIKHIIRSWSGKPDPAPIIQAQEGPIGIEISMYEQVRHPLYEAPFAGLRESFQLSWNLAQGIGVTVWKLVSFQPVAKDIAGPLGIAEMTGEAIKFGWNAVLDLMGLLSLNLAIVNILPIPALDGGRLLFVVIEAVAGKKINPEAERYAHQIGMMILLALILLVSINDIVRIFGR